jgi:hypothetical protein
MIRLGSTNPLLPRKSYRRKRRTFNYFIDTLIEIPWIELLGAKLQATRDFQFRN